MTEIFLNKNIRQTAFREKVLAVFDNNKTALSIEFLESEIGEHDRTTLYRTIKTFIDKGVLHEVVLPNEPKKLALCDTSCSSEEHVHQHIHFKCTSCTKIYCKEIDELPTIAIPGFTVNSFEINASGLCNKCL